MRLTGILLVVLCLVARAALAADPQPYSVKFESTGNKALDGAIKATSQLDTLRGSAPAGPFALIGRAQSDIERLQTVCESYGYYRREITITIAGHPLDQMDLPGVLLALPKSPAVQIQIKVQLGPLYHVRKITLEGDVSDQARAALALQSGAPAIAGQVLAAGQRLQDALQEEGHAFARVDTPLAFEDTHDPVLDVSFKVTAGPVYRIGDIRIQGLKRTHAQFVKDRVSLRRGDVYSPSKIERARSDLLGLGVFAGVTVQLPKKEEVTGDSVSITFEVSERKPCLVADVPHTVVQVRLPVRFRERPQRSRQRPCPVQQLAPLLEHVLDVGADRDQHRAPQNEREGQGCLPQRLGHWREDRVLHVAVERVLSGLRGGLAPLDLRLLLLLDDRFLDHRDGLAHVVEIEEKGWREHRLRQVRDHVPHDLFQS